MTLNTDKLLSISSEGICDSKPQLDESIKDILGTLSDEFHNLLSVKNGFYAFESALHVFPATNDSVPNLSLWNSPDLWKSEYSSSIKDYLFFAEDIFGVQFCIFMNEICTFDPETEEIEAIAPSFDEWSKCILEKYNYWTGFDLAHQWQLENGIIPIGKRLLPKIPFVLGGKFAIDNLYLLDSVTGMIIRGDLARQIKYCPEGTKIKLKVID
jgi:hypothetical protein